jgi:hypothetical protein
MVKRRVIKKWMNRYIIPEIKGLPIAKYRVFFVESETGKEIHDESEINSLKAQVINNAYKIIDGHIVPEGNLVKRERNKRQAFERTAQIIREIKQNHRYVFVRSYPEYRFGYLRIRLLTEEVTQ